jgi:hypothetical protein
MARGGSPKTHPCEGDVPPCGSRDLCRLSVWHAGESAESRNAKECSAMGGHHALARHGVRGSDSRAGSLAPVLLYPTRPRSPSPRIHSKGEIPLSKARMCATGKRFQQTKRAASARITSPRTIMSLTCLKVQIENSSCVDTLRSLNP